MFGSGVGQPSHSTLMPHKLPETCMTSEAFVTSYLSLNRSDQLQRGHRAGESNGVAAHPYQNVFFKIEALDEIPKQHTIKHATAMSAITTYAIMSGFRPCKRGA